MRVFWSILGLLIIALAGMLVMRDRSIPSSSAPEPVPVPVPVVAQPQAPANNATPSPSPAPEPPATPAAALNVADADITTPVRATPDGFEVVPAPAAPTPSAPTKAPEASTPAPPNPPTPQTPAAQPASSPNPDSRIPTPAPPSPLDDTTDPILQAINEQMTGESPRPITITPVAPLPHTIAAPPTPSASSNPGAPKPASSSAPSAAANQTHSVVKQDDGTTLVDNRFIMKGSGTKTDPYRITWEQLVSADEVYQPRLGRKVLPDRVKMLDGKWVRMSGYIAFPIMATSQDEMLLMLNQWDGCCIGVPPTPFDAVEVKLNAAAKGETRLRATGTVQGILRVDPYLVKDWLVSLYLMDNAELVESGGVQPAESPVHGK